MAPERCGDRSGRGWANVSNGQGYKYAPQWLLFGFFEFLKEPLGVGCWVATPGVKVGHLFPAACWLALGTFLAPYVDIRQLRFQRLIAGFSQFEELGVGG